MHNHYEDMPIFESVDRVTSELLLYLFQIITNLTNRTKKMKKLKYVITPEVSDVTESLNVKFQPSSQP